MKITKRLISFVLVLTMLSGICCVGTFASSVSDDLSSYYKKGTGYVAFGDSITCGYGATDTWDAEGYNMVNRIDNCRNVHGSYPKIIADALGLYTPDNICDTSGEYWPLSFEAETTDFVNDLLGLEDKLKDVDYMYTYSSLKKRYNSALYYFGIEEKA